MRIKETQLFRRLTVNQSNEPFKLVVYLHGTEEELTQTLKKISMDCVK
jgi:hypothetical protein